MNDQDMDKLLEQSLAGDPPGQVFRARVLLDSTAALARRRRPADRWWSAGLAAAAVLVAAVSFLGGRYSVPWRQTGAPPVATLAGGDGTVTVPSEMVAWVNAARLFKQLGMEDRMARAVERAGRLLPVDTVIADAQTVRVFAAAGSMENREERVPPMGMPGPNPSVQSVSQILAQAFED
jgi:hypothetical protein